MASAPKFLTTSVNCHSVFLRPQPTCCNLTPHAGYSLVELTGVVLILGIMAAVVIPNFSSTDPAKLDLAVQITADALRFARSESIRTGTVHGALIDVDDNRADTHDIHVFEVDDSTNRYTIGATVYHPLTKQPYNLWIRRGNLGQHVSFKPSPLPFSYRGFGVLQRSIFFSLQGEPLHKKAGVFYPLESGQVTLASGKLERTISVQPITGQVIIQ